MGKPSHRQFGAQALGAIGLALSLAALSPAHASPYSGVVFFGDSLSDTGNVQALTAAFSPPAFPTYPGAPGRFSNGPVWTEYLAAGLGYASAANASHLLYAGAPGVIATGAPGGQNYAYGGARTGLGGAAGATTGLLGQLIAWNGSVFGQSLTRTADSDALYVVVAGANDLRDARNAYASSSAGDTIARAAAAATVAQNLTNTLALLAQAGARHFLISNLPDLGATPESMMMGNMDVSTEVTLDFNQALAADVGGLDAQFMSLFGVDLDIRTMDLFGLSASIRADAINNNGAKYGITNVSTACLAPGPFSKEYFFADATDINCSVSAFSDPLHPSAVVGKLIGAMALNTVPEPGSLGLVGLAAVLAAGGLRRRRS